jgi:hypothetical protein
MTMKKISLTVLLLVPLLVFSQNYYGYFGDGAWTDVANWDTYPGETLAVDDYVYIFGNITETTANITNNGIIELHGNIVLSNTSGFTNTGTIELMLSGSLSMSTGVSFTNDRGLIRNEGTITNENTTFTNTGNIARVINNGNFFNINGALFINDFDASVSVNWSGTFVNDNSTVENKNDAGFGSSTPQGIQNINGSIFHNLSNAIVVPSVGGFDNTSGSTFNNDAIVFLSDGGFINRDMAVFNNNQNGFVNVRYFSTFSNRSFFNNNAGATIFVDADSNFANVSDGVLINNGTITNESILFTSAVFGGVNTAHTGTLYNTDTFSPGNSVGTYILNGDYIQTDIGTLAIEIEGTGTNYDVLQANNITIDGTLLVTLPTLYDPQVGDTFSIVTGNSITGTFATENLPALSNNKMWQIQYVANEVRLEVTSTLHTAQVEAPEKVILYPNPTTGVVFLENLPTTTNKYTIFSILGETIRHGTLQGTSINISELTAGSYYIKIDDTVFTILKQ